MKENEIQQRQAPPCLKRDDLPQPDLPRDTPEDTPAVQDPEATAPPIRLGSFAFQQIRSATAIVTYGGVRFLIDPWLGDKESVPGLPAAYEPTRRSPFHDLPLPISEITQVDAVIATHLHFDHFDEAAATVLPKDMPIFTQDGVDAATLRSRGFNDVRILRFNGTDFKGVTLYKVDCMHAAPGERGRLYEAYQMRGDACGVVMRHPDVEKALYLAGDTIWCDYVADAIHNFQPGVIVVNAAEATLRGFSPIIMGLHDLRKVLAYAPNATVVASHMDNVPHARLTRKDLRLFVEMNHLQQRLLVPEDGETLLF